MGYEIIGDGEAQHAQVRLEDRGGLHMYWHIAFVNSEREDDETYVAFEYDELAKLLRHLKERYPDCWVHMMKIVDEDYWKRLGGEGID